MMVRSSEWRIPLAAGRARGLHARGPHVSRSIAPLHIATRELFHYFFKCWVFLPHDLIKPRRLDPRCLELLIQSARFDRFVLACIAYE